MKDQRDICSIRPVSKMLQAIDEIDHDYRASCYECAHMVQEEELPSDVRTAWWGQTEAEAQQIADTHNSIHDGHSCKVSKVGV